MISNEKELKDKPWTTQTQPVHTYFHGRTLSVLFYENWKKLALYCLFTRVVHTIVL